MRDQTNRMQTLGNSRFGPRALTVMPMLSSGSAFNGSGLYRVLAGGDCQAREVDLVDAVSGWAGGLRLW